MINIVRSPLLKGQRIEGRLPLEAKIGLSSAILAGVVAIVFGLAAATSQSTYNDGFESTMLGVVMISVATFVWRKLS